MLCLFCLWFVCLHEHWCGEETCFSFSFLSFSLISFPSIDTSLWVFKVLVAKWSAAWGTIGAHLCVLVSILAWGRVGAFLGACKHRTCGKCLGMAFEWFATIVGIGWEGDRSARSWATGEPWGLDLGSQPSGCVWSPFLAGLCCPCVMWSTCLGSRIIAWICASLWNSHLFNSTTYLVGCSILFSWKLPLDMAHEVCSFLMVEETHPKGWIYWWAKG